MPDRLTTEPEPGPTVANLIWLASYPKSGNTWLRAFLHNYLRNCREPHDINALRDLCAVESDAGLYRRFDARPAHLWTRADVARMRPLLHRALTVAFPGTVFVKTHNALVLEQGRPILTPEVTAGAIYLVRDPRDVAVSYAHHLGLTVDEVIERMADEETMTGGTDLNVIERLGSWSSHVAGWTERPNPRLLVLRYEDLLADPEAGFGRVIAFLGDPPDPERLSRAVSLTAFKVLADQEQAAGFVERPAAAEQFFRSGRAGAWRRALDPAQASRIRARHRRVMAAFGYR